MTYYGLSRSCLRGLSPQILPLTAPVYLYFFIQIPKKRMQLAKMIFFFSEEHVTLYLPTYDVAVYQVISPSTSYSHEDRITYTHGCLGGSSSAGCLIQAGDAVTTGQWKKDDVANVPETDEKKFKRES